MSQLLKHYSSNILVWVISSFDIRICFGLIRQADTSFRISTFGFGLNKTFRSGTNYSFNLLLTIFAFFLIISCAHTPGVVGKWREVGKTATVEFWKDGTFEAVDNQGMAVSGKYTLSENGNARFEIEREGSPPEIVSGKISVRGEELTLVSGDGEEVDKYKRER